MTLRFKAPSKESTAHRPSVKQSAKQYEETSHTGSTVFDPASAVSGIDS
jgi:hypothetical protein